MKDIWLIGLKPDVSGRPLTSTNWWWFSGLALMKVSSTPPRPWPLSVIIRPNTVV